MHDPCITPFVAFILFLGTCCMDTVETFKKPHAVEIQQFKMDISEYRVSEQGREFIEQYGQRYANFETLNMNRPPPPKRK